jgi:4-amino-4-deoxy-L-arabinose transferase-like glycosyltransferase
LPTIVAIAFLIRLAYCFLVFPRIGDALNWRGVDDGYDELARNVLDGHGYVMAPGRPGNLLTPPGYACFLSGLYAAFGAEMGEGPRLWVAQAALDALTCGILYAIGALVLGSRRTGLLAAVAWALYPQIIVYSARIAPEVLFTLLFVLLFVAWLSLEMRGGAARAALAGALWAALTLTKEKAILLPVVLLARLLWVRRWERPLFRRESAAFLLCALVLLSPWLYRGYRLTGGLVPITLRGGRALEEGYRKEFGGADTYMVDDLEKDLRRGPIPGDSLPRLTEEERLAQARRFREHESSRLSRIVSEILHSPAAFARKALVRLAAFWYWGQPRVILGNAIVNLPLLAAGVIGLRVAWGMPPASVALLLIAYMNVLHAVTVVRMRYSLPVMPLVVLFAAYALARLSPEKR